ncbi:MAG: alpha/beta hydrolase [Acidimicrobiales bacterium]
MPRRGGGRPPVVVLIHGGFWLPEYDRSLMEPLARDVVARGWAAWNLDYRVPGRGAGGWPGTFLDVAQGVDHLAVAAGRHDLDLGRVVVVGHSAGGCLALWAAARRNLPAGAPGADPGVTPGLAISQAGVNDLVAGAALNLGQGAVVNLMGQAPPPASAPPDPADRYGLASPSARLPIGVPLVLVHGDRDEIVPLTQSTEFATRAKGLGDTVTVLTVAEASHFDVIDPSHRAWSDATVAIEASFTS